MNAMLNSGFVPQLEIHEITSASCLLSKSNASLRRYLYCLLGGMSMTDYSKARGIDVSTVFEAKRDVQKKAKIFFKETPKN